MASKASQPKYIGQTGPGMCCTPIAMCNALRYWGLPSPVPDTRAWETMVDLAGCRHGATVNSSRTAEWLGLIRSPTSLDFLRRGECLPSMVSFRSRDCGLHSALVIDTREGTRKWAPELHFVNFRGTGKGPLLEWIPWDDVAWDDGNDEKPIGWWLLPRWDPRESVFEVEL